jgi:PAS domain S-box-containing protein
MNRTQAMAGSNGAEQASNETYKRIELLKMSQAVNLLGSWEWDLRSNKLFWTDAMFQLRATPVSVDNLISLEDNEHFIHEDDRELVKEKFASLSRKQDVNFEYRIVTTDGKVKLVAAWATMFRDEDGTPLFIRGTSQDITQQREAENKLKELNLAFGYAEEIANMGNWQYKVRSNEFFISTNLYKLLGYQPGEFESSFDKLIETIHPEDREKMKDYLAKCSNGDCADPIEYRVSKKSGQEIYIRSKCKVLHEFNNETLILGTMQDITDEVEVRRALEEKSSFAQMLIENSVDHIAAYDNDLRIIAWNRKCEQRYNIKKEDALGKHVFEVYNELSPEQFSDLQKALKGEHVHKPAQISSSADGMYEYFMIPLKDPNGKVFGILSILHDLSAIKKSTDRLNELNRSLESKNRELERSNDEMASFSYVASHDLQEPLRKIQTFARLIHEKDFDVLSEKGKDYFQRMQAASSRMQILIDDLLTFSRTNTLPKEFKTTDLNQVLESVKKEIKDSIEENNATIHSTPLPTANVVAFQIKQLLENLLLNSIKYAKKNVPPVINITSSIVEGQNLDGLAADRRYIRIDIEDNGIGFDQQYAEKIFELFQRLHGKHEYPGTGLGLAICKKIIQNHKGLIKAEGREGIGSIFSIFLPE